MLLLGGRAGDHQLLRFPEVPVQGTSCGVPFSSQSTGHHFPGTNGQKWGQKPLYVTCEPSRDGSPGDSWIVSASQVNFIPEYRKYM